MNDALTVRIVQRIRNVIRDCERAIERDGSVGETIGERLPLEVFHHQEIDPLVMAEVIERADVRMIENGNRSRLTVETSAGRRIRAEAFGEYLDRHRSIKAPIARAIHLTHSTGANGRDDFVGPDACARGENQRAEYNGPEVLRRRPRPECSILRVECPSERFIS